MALFGNKEDKAAKKDERLEQWMATHGLAGMKPEYADLLKSLAGVELGVALQRLGASSADISKEYLYIIKEQNWMIIRLLNDIANK